MGLRPGVGKMKMRPTAQGRRSSVTWAFAVFPSEAGKLEHYAGASKRKLKCIRVVGRIPR
jgi:hypothetical protein